MEEIKWAEQRPVYYATADKFRPGQVIIAKEFVIRGCIEPKNYRIVDEGRLLDYDGVEYPIDKTEYALLYSFFKTE